MDRERLTDLLQDPTQVAKEDLADLRSMTERFPWFSGAHLLLAVGEHVGGDVLSNDPARTPAAYLPSRAVLFDLTRADAPAPPAPMRVVKDTLESAPPEPDDPLPKDPIEPSPVVPAAAAGSDPEHPQLATLETQQIDAAAASTPSHDPLDAQIRESARISAFDLSRELPPPLPIAPEAPVSLAPKPPQTPVIQAPVTIRVSAINQNGKLRFTDWLSTSAEGLPSAGPAPAPPPTATANPPVPLSNTAQTGVDIPDPGAIIERFIHRGESAVPPVKTPFFTPQQAAKRSLQDEGLVSETLAKIYERQGDLAKAIETYDRLAVLHPGKSVYFAALSKALEARSNK